MEKNPSDILSVGDEDGKDHHSKDSNIPSSIIYQDFTENKRLVKAKDKKTRHVLDSGTDAVDVSCRRRSLVNK